jgi:hypothetical protein
MKERIVPPGLLSLSLDLLLTMPLHGFAIARGSHVSLPCFRAATLFPKYVLMVPSSIAIWLKNKVIMAVAIGLWVTNASISISGKSPPIP